MRLLHTREHALKDFPNAEEAEKARYAILSHRWESPEKEVTYKQFTDRPVTEAQLNDGTERLNAYGWKKIFAACEIARERPIDWIW